VVEKMMTLLLKKKNYLICLSEEKLDAFVDIGSENIFDKKNFSFI
jgi:hypothetical protein